MLSGNKKIQLIEIIDLKIKSLESEEKKRGINVWVVWGAIATSSWLFLDVLEKGVYINGALIWFVIFCFSYQIAELFKTLNSSQLTLDRTGGRYLLFEPEMRLYITVQLSLSFLLLFLFLKNNHFYFFDFWAIYAVLIFELFNYGWILIMNFMKFPIPLNKSYFKISPFVIFLKLTILVFLLNELRFFNDFSLNISEIRAGLLMSAIFLLVTFLSKMPYDIKEVAKLKNLQMAIAIGDIDVFHAEKKYSELLKGLTLPGVFKETNERINNLFMQVEKELEVCKFETLNVSQKVKEFNKTIKKGIRGSQKKSQVNKDKAKEILNSINLKEMENPLKAAYETLDRIKNKNDEQNRLLKWLILLGSDSVIEYIKKLDMEHERKYRRTQKRIMAINDAGEKCRTEMKKTFELME